ncbi:hypothetical protein CR513_29525, partial [Mucuna pruriens]
MLSSSPRLRSTKESNPSRNLKIQLTLHPIGKRTQRPHREKLISTLQGHANLFAWQSSDMPGIDSKVIYHRLAICTEAKSIAQRKRKIRRDKREVIEQETTKLKVVHFIREVS